MSYAIVQKLREMSDEELFDTCIVNLVHMYKKGIYRFENEKNIPLHKIINLRKVSICFNI